MALSASRFADQSTRVPVAGWKSSSRRGVTSTVSESGGGTGPHSVERPRVDSVTAQPFAESATAGSHSIAPLIVPRLSPEAAVPSPTALSAEQFANAGHDRLLRKR